MEDGRTLAKRRAYGRGQLLDAEPATRLNANRNGNSRRETASIGNRKTDRCFLRRSRWRQRDLHTTRPQVSHGSPSRRRDCGPSPSGRSQETRGHKSELPCRTGSREDDFVAQTLNLRRHGNDGGSESQVRAGFFGSRVLVGLGEADERRLKIEGRTAQNTESCHRSRRGAGRPFLHVAGGIEKAGPESEGIRNIRTERT